MLVVFWIFADVLLLMRFQPQLDDVCGPPEIEAGLRLRREK
jgi:hypothetical protein